MIDTLLALGQGAVDLPWWGYLLVLAVTTHITIAAVTIFLHRSQAHRALDLHPIVSHFFRLWLWLTTGMVTREWVAIHRKHHAKCETAEDPHSPAVYGHWGVLRFGVDLYRKEARNAETIARYGYGTPDDWLERNVYGRFPEAGPTLMLLINVTLFGMWGLFIWALQMIWIPFMAAGVVNGLGHWWGYRNFESDDTSTNLTPWGVVIGGEELHNNHHTFPSSAKFALRKWEFDLGWAVIHTLQAVGLAKVLRVAPSLDIRPNVSLPDGETIKAMLTHRFQVTTDYFRVVIVPTLREEAAHAGESLKAMPRKLRRALADGGRWLDDAARERLQAVLDRRPTLATVCEFRARLATLMEQRSGETMLKGLQQWCHEAEASGIRALQEFSARLKGYALAPA